MENITPFNISWLISDKCNYDCKFCFMVPGRKSVGLAEAKNILDNLYESGVRKISFAGGEPLLWQGIEELLQYAKTKRITTMLITNGSLLTPTLVSRLSGALDWLSLPLDGPNEEVSVKMSRPPGHFDNTLATIDFCTRETDFKLKVNTVASKINIGRLVDLYNIIRKHAVSRWKVFQFFPVRHSAIKHQSIFYITDDEFNRLKEVIEDIVNGDNKVLLSVESIHDLKESYVTVAPDGHCYISSGDGDQYLGDLKQVSLWEMWKEVPIDKGLYLKRNEWLLEHI